MKDNFAHFYLFAFIFCYNILNINTRTSNLWRLRPVDGKISHYHEEEKAFGISSREDQNDKIFNIILTTALAYEGSWMKLSNEQLGVRGFLSKGVDYEIPRSKAKAAIPVQEKDDNLDCGIPVNFTYYDYLIGVGQRLAHPLVPEPEVAYVFLKNKAERSLRTFDINALERRLKKAKKEKPRSVSLYNQIGNYWRIKGDARQSIECFRRALSISPTNAEVLLNLARVLFSLQYLDDAIHLTKRSLEVQAPGKSAWRQYFTLGEIFKAYGHFQESLLHLRHALELYPQHEPILKALRDVENIPASSLHVYTLFIIFILVLAVFIVIITSTESSHSSLQVELEPKIQRHFNRAMAMRSLKGFSSHTSRHRKH